MKGPKMTSVKPFIWKNQLSLSLKKQTRNTYEPHQQMTTTEHQVPDLGMTL